MSKTLESHCWRDAMVACGTASMQGFRNNMEDGSAVLLSLTASSASKYRFCGVFDGHASSKKAATYLEEHLPRKIGEQKQRLWMSRAGLENACIQVDREILRSNFSDAGSTAVFCVLQNSHTSTGGPVRVSIGSVGDSQAMIMHADFSKPPTVPLERDVHRPHLMESEKDRIRKAGGFVANNRVDGELAVSRAFGDSRFKRDISRKLHEQKVIALPAVVDNLNLHRGDVLLLACDGLFDVMTPAVIDTFIRGTLVSVLVKKSQEEKSLWSISETLSEVAGKLLDEAILRGSRDNMTVMLIHALPPPSSGSPLIPWSDKFSKRYIPPILFDKSPPGFTAMLKDELATLRLDEDLTLSQCEKIFVGDVRGIPIGLSRAQMAAFFGNALNMQWENKQSWVYLGEFEIPDPKYIFTGGRRRSSLAGTVSGINAWDRFVQWIGKKMACGATQVETKPQASCVRMSSSLAIFSRVSSVHPQLGESTTQTNSMDDALFMVSSTSDLGEPESRLTSADEESN